MKGGFQADPVTSRYLVPAPQGLSEAVGRVFSGSPGVNDLRAAPAGRNARNVPAPVGVGAKMRG